MNKIIITGNLTADPEYTTTQGGLQYAKFTVAVKRNTKNENNEYESDFLNVVAFRQIADYVGKYIKKGNKVGVVGSIQTRSYTGKDGQKRYVTEIIASEVEGLTPKSENTSSYGSQYARQQVYQQKQQIMQGFTEIPTSDGNLPF